MKELAYTLTLPVNKEYFFSLEQMKAQDAPIFWQGPVGFVRIEDERYEVKATGRPIEGLIPYLQSGRE